MGKVGILAHTATCNQQINAIIPESVDSSWLAYAILSQREIISEMANAPVVPIINKGDFSDILVPVPPIGLQKEFASKIGDIDKQKSIILDSLKDSEKLLNSRMDYYFND